MSGPELLLVLVALLVTHFLGLLAVIVFSILVVIAMFLGVGFRGELATKFARLFVRTLGASGPAK